MTTEHTYTPADESFSEKIFSLKKVMSFMREVKSSLQFKDDDQWRDQLDSDQEIESAHTVAQNSLKEALSDMNVVTDDQLS